MVWHGIILSGRTALVFLEDYLNGTDARTQISIWCITTVLTIHDKTFKMTCTVLIFQFFRIWMRYVRKMHLVPKFGNIKATTTFPMSNRKIILHWSSIERLIDSQQATVIQVGN